MSGLFQVEVRSGETRVVGVPPPHQGGRVPFERVFVSLASDFDGARVRFAVGRPGRWRIEENLSVGPGRGHVHEVESGDELASVVHHAGEPVSLLVEYSHIYTERAAAGARMVNASHVVAPRSATTVVALAPVNREGLVQFPTGFLSLATDFDDARARLAIGHPDAWRIEEDLVVPIGRRVVRELQAGDQVASIVHRAGREIGVLLEYMTSASTDA